MSDARPRLSLIVVVCLAGCSSQATPYRGEAAQTQTRAEERPRGKFTVGKETTFVTEPLDAAGRVDYVAALNKRLKGDTTPETNAVVLLWKAFGPRPEDRPTIAAHFDLLGVPPPPENGDYFRPFGTHAGLDGAAGPDRLAEPSRRPWTAAEFPDVAAWLAAIEKPLAVVVEATKRPGYFYPLVPEPSAVGRTSFFDVMLPLAQQSRLAQQALVVRAMLHLGRGERDVAWADLVASHRLARHVGRGGTLIEGLVGCAEDMISCRTDIVFLEHTGGTLADIERWAKEFDELPPLPDVAATVELSDRFTMLDLVMQVDRHGMAAFPGVDPAAPQPHAEMLDGIDLDPTLRIVNKWIDRMAATMRAPTYAARQQGGAKMETELRSLKAQLNTDEYRAAVQNAPDLPQAKGRALGDILVVLLLPAANRVREAADRARQHHDNLRVAFALARHRADRGTYPAALDALAPKYMPAVPSDRFSGKPLVYRPAADGYLLYSVGVNARDDGGRGHDATPPADDIEVRIPATLRKP